MAKISYSNLKLKTRTDIKTFDYEGNTIEVLQYLPFEDKYSLIMIALQNAQEEGIYNPLKLDLYFHLFLVYMYTNINFTEKQRENELKLYDALKSNGILDEVLANIPEQEYATLFEFLNEMVTVKTEYGKSVVSLVQSLIHDLPTQAQAAKEILDNFDKNKFEEVINFAKAANGGRDI
jgi:hypothetical protein